MQRSDCPAVCPECGETLIDVKAVKQVLCLGCEWRMPYYDDMNWVWTMGRTSGPIVGDSLAR